MTHDNIPTVCGHVQPHPPTTPTTGYFTNSTTEQVTLAHVGQMLATVAAVAYSPTAAAATPNSMSIWDHHMWFGYNTHYHIW